jgi:hypothetical protein
MLYLLYEVKIRYIEYSCSKTEKVSEIMLGCVHSVLGEQRDNPLASPLPHERNLIIITYLGILTNRQNDIAFGNGASARELGQSPSDFMIDVLLEGRSELNVLTVHNDGNFLVCRAHVQNRQWRLLMRRRKGGSATALLGKRCRCRQQREEA